MILPSRSLQNIEELYNLKEKGTISAAEYQSSVRGILNALFEGGDLPIYCIEQAESLFKKGAITEASFERLKNMALNTDRPVKEKPVKSGQIKRKSPRSLWPLILRGMLIVFAAIVHVILFMLSIPFIIIGTICDWKIKESIIAEGIKKSSKK